MGELRNQLAAPQYGQSVEAAATLGQDPYGKMGVLQGATAGSRSNSMASTGNSQNQNAKNFKNGGVSNIITTMITPKKPRNGQTSQN
mmetsp:Transcript_40604/g.53262  ORF Transcript_40604/g.53262 Transcript_40604/m.53262 type:complete len:87 (+) Transcript_40604:1107-1367(+)